MNCKRRLKHFYKKIGSSYRCYWCHERIAGL